MATIKLTLDNRRARKDNSFPIIFRLSLKGQNRIISTGYYCLAKEWNIKTNTVKSINPLSESINNSLQQQEIKYLSRLHDFRMNHPHGSIKELKNFLLQEPKKSLTIEEFWSNQMLHLKACNREGGARVYKDSLNAIKSVYNLDIPFEKFTYSELSKIEGLMFTKNLKINTVSVYLRTFRTICNKAILEGLVSHEWYPFRKFKIQRSRIAPRVLSIDELRTYFNYKVSNPTYYKSWLIGKLIFMLRGVNIKDLLLLNENNIKGDRIIYKRAKTGKLYSIKLDPEMLSILDEFESTNTLLGVIPAADFQNADKLVSTIKFKTKSINTHLKKIGKELVVNEPITTYVFRYSYANTAKKLGYSKDLIAEALGHDYGNSVTGIYLEQFDLELVDNMNRSIISHINK